MMERLGNIKKFEKSENPEEMILAVLGGAANVYARELGHEDNMHVTIDGYSIIKDVVYKIDVDSEKIVPEKKVLDTTKTDMNVPDAMLAVMAGAAKFMGSKVMILDDKVFYIKDNEVYSAKVCDDG